MVSAGARADRALSGADHHERDQQDGPDRVEVGRPMHHPDGQPARRPRHTLRERAARRRRDESVQQAPVVRQRGRQAREPHHGEDTTEDRRQRSGDDDLQTPPRRTRERDQQQGCPGSDEHRDHRRRHHERDHRGSAELGHGSPAAAPPRAFAQGEEQTGQEEVRRVLLDVARPLDGDGTHGHHERAPDAPPPRHGEPARQRVHGDDPRDPECERQDLGPPGRRRIQQDPRPLRHGETSGGDPHPPRRRRPDPCRQGHPRVVAPQSNAAQPLET